MHHDLLSRYPSTILMLRCGLSQTMLPSESRLPPMSQKRNRRVTFATLCCIAAIPRLGCEVFKAYETVGLFLLDLSRLRDAKATAIPFLLMHGDER
jgi:hypothetical protein